MPVSNYSDPDGLKLYTISAKAEPVDHGPYLERLTDIKRQKKISSSIPAFAIFHDGATMQYLVVGWWMNENELFISVSVREEAGWVEAPDKYSFCIWDLEIIWHERNSFIRHMYSGNPNIEAYRKDLKPG
jgi:hypothetical protein